MVELKKCPFCGGGAVSRTFVVSENAFMVCCRNCGARTPLVFARCKVHVADPVYSWYKDNEDEAAECAAELWNTRSD